MANISEQKKREILDALKRAKADEERRRHEIDLVQAEYKANQQTTKYDYYWPLWQKLLKLSKYKPWCNRFC